MPSVADPYATVPAATAPAAGPMPSGELPGAAPIVASESFPKGGMISGGPINPAGGGEVDKVSMILAVVSFLIVVGMVVVLAMMKVE